MIAVALALGCAHGGALQSVSTQGWNYFGPSASTDPWSPKIAGWQSREIAAPDAQAQGELASVSGPAEASLPAAAAEEPAIGGGADHDTRDTLLRDKYFEFRRERKRAMAREVAEWIQTEARRHYVPDGAVDHWATLEETLERDGDDCDGLELLVYHFLRDLGFADDEVYRAIVVRPEDGQHHMVTFWFEEPGDPWVIDPTGAMTAGMPRMSDVAGWVPLKVFSETEEFSAQPLAAR